jgi:hypothetical protein
MSQSLSTVRAAMSCAPLKEFDESGHGHISVGDLKQVFFTLDPEISGDLG